jgi:hypothetical protein
MYPLPQVPAALAVAPNAEHIVTTRNLDGLVPKAKDSDWNTTDWMAASASLWNTTDWMAASASLWILAKSLQVFLVDRRPTRLGKCVYVFAQVVE